MTNPDHRHYDFYISNIQCLYNTSIQEELSEGLKRYHETSQGPGRPWITLFTNQRGWLVYLAVSSSSRSPPLPILTHHQLGHLGGFLIHLLVDHLVKLLVHHHPHDHLHLHISPFGLPNCTFSWLLSTWGWVAPPLTLAGPTISHFQRLVITH